eukprot:3321410-Rhodomonas_salina.1
MSVNPSVGLEGGGTLVTLMGSGFDSLTRVGCRFGDILVTGTVRSGSFAECFAPSNSEGSLRLHVVDLGSNSSVFEGQSFVNFEYVGNPTITSVHPSFGFDGISTSVAVSGSSFATGSVCLFSNQENESHAVSADVSTTSVVCSSFDLAAGDWEIRIADQDSLVGSNVFPFLVISPSAFSGVKPSWVPASGGVPVTILGSNFPRTKSYVIRLNRNYTRQARWLSSDSILVLSPAVDQPGSGVIEISSDGINFFSTRLPFVFHPDFEIRSMMPSVSRPEGGTLITISGHSFPSEKRLECRFDGMRVIATRLSETTLQCFAPHHAPGTVSLTLIADSMVEANTSLPFVYLHNVVANVLLPSSGMAAGGSLITVLGSDFVQAVPSSFECNFGGIPVDTTIVSASQMLCLSPPRSQTGSVSFDISQNGALGQPSGLEFAFLDPLDIVSMDPISGVRLQAAEIQLKVASQMQIEGDTPLSCTFGTQTVPAGYNSEAGSIVCRVWSFTVVGNVSVAVTTQKRGHFTLNFAFLVEATCPHSIAPSMGPVNGGTSVHVSGVDATQKSSAACTFDDISVPATPLSSTMLVCTAPSHIPEVVNFT